MYELLNDESKFKQLTSNPTKLREGQLQKEKSDIPPLRSIVSSINSYTLQVICVNY